MFSIHSNRDPKKYRQEKKNSVVHSCSKLVESLIGINTFAENSYFYLSFILRYVGKIHFLSEKEKVYM